MPRKARLRPQRAVMNSASATRSFLISAASVRVGMLAMEKSKRCPKCKLIKSEDDFAYLCKAEGTRSVYCRACQSAYYLHNKSSYRARAKKHKRKRQFKILDWLSTHPCGCGEADPVLLDFDHDDPTTKTDDVSSMVAGGYSWAKIEKEISKCTVRCCKCHRKKTAKESGWQVVVDGWMLKNLNFEKGNNLSSRNN